MKDALFGFPTFEVLETRSAYTIVHSDCLSCMDELPDNCVDLVFGSPPYEDRRHYGELDFRKEGQEWVDWMMTLVPSMVRICKGLVALVVGHGKTEDHQWSAVPALLMADLHRAGYCLRNPPIYRRNGIMGSGGKDWLRADYETIVCVSKERGVLPWSNNVALGKPPKYAPGGAASHRLPSGQRRNQWGGDPRGISKRKEDGSLVQEKRPSHKVQKNGAGKVQPVLANPGNVIDCKVGGGMLGHPFAHRNEAPFPLALAEFFVLSFCPPNGVVFDPFCGSGTTLHAAIENRRSCLTTDIRGSQCEIAFERIQGVTPRMVIESDQRREEGRDVAEEVHEEESAATGLWSGGAGGDGGDA